VQEVARLGELGGRVDGRGGPGVPGLLDTIRSGQVSLVVNTPEPLPGPVRDAAAIRHAAIAEGILCLTAIETAVAAAASLDPALRVAIEEVRPLDAWLSVASIPVAG